MNAALALCVLASLAVGWICYQLHQEDKLRAAEKERRRLLGLANKEEDYEDLSWP